jgi:hypothetical protein
MFVLAVLTLRHHSCIVCHNQKPLIIRKYIWVSTQLCKDASADWFSLGTFPWVEWMFGVKGRVGVGLVRLLHRTVHLHCEGGVMCDSNCSPPPPVVPVRALLGIDFVMFRIVAAALGKFPCKKKKKKIPLHYQKVEHFLFPFFFSYRASLWGRVVVPGGTLV